MLQDVQVIYKGMSFLSQMRVDVFDDEQDEVDRTEKRRVLWVSQDEYVDAVVGYRTWKLYVNRGVAGLRSVVQSATVWEPAQALEARCMCWRGAWRLGKIEADWEYKHGPDEPPCKGTCGIYAFNAPIIPCTQSYIRHMGLYRTFAQLEEMLSVPVLYVSGEVLMWGKLQRHEYGYRSEYASVGALYTHVDMGEPVRQLVALAAHQYRVPLVQHGSQND